MCESGARSRWRHSSCPSSSCPHLASCSFVSAQGYFWLALVWMFFSHVILREASCVFLVQWHFWGAREDFVRKVTYIFCKQSQQVFRGAGEPLIFATLTWNVSDQHDRRWSGLLLSMPRGGWRLKVTLSIPLGMDSLGLAADGSSSFAFSLSFTQRGNVTFVSPCHEGGWFC